MKFIFPGSWYHSPSVPVSSRVSLLLTQESLAGWGTRARLCCLSPSLVTVPCRAVPGFTAWEEVTQSQPSSLEGEPGSQRWGNRRRCREEVVEAGSRALGQNSEMGNGSSGRPGVESPVGQMRADPLWLVGLLLVSFSFSALAPAFLPSRHQGAEGGRGAPQLLFLCLFLPCCLVGLRGGAPGWGGEGEVPTTLLLPLSTLVS